MKCILLVEHVRESLCLLLLVSCHCLLVKLLHILNRGGTLRHRLFLAPLLTTLLCYFPTPFLLSLLRYAILCFVIEINCRVRLGSEGGLWLFLFYHGSLWVLGRLLVKH